MLTLNDCKKHFNESKKTYTDEELKKIRDFLYKMARLQVEYEQNLVKTQN